MMSTFAKVATDRLVEGRASRVSSTDILVYGLTFVPGIVLLAAVALQTRVPIFVLMKDSLVVVQLTKECCHVYYGLISNLGVMLWTAGAAVCLFAALILVTNGQRDSRVVFLVAAGLFTGWLGLDDFFMVHEDVLPLFGVSQRVTYAAYATIAALYFLFSWRHILMSRPMLMMSALTLLGTSVLIDVLVHSESALHVFAEDGAKFLGILAWTSFHVTAALDLTGKFLGSALGRFRVT
jgi:hypothetical protein